LIGVIQSGIPGVAKVAASTVCGLSFQDCDINQSFVDAYVMAYHDKCDDTSAGDDLLTYAWCG
jgi:hypothetical protein